MHHVDPHASFRNTEGSSMGAFAMRVTRVACLAGVVLAGGLGGCSSKAAECIFPGAPSGATALSYVCATGTGDGSAESSPSATIGQALSAAKPGSAILVAAGRYDEALVIDRAVSLVGSDGSSADAAPVEIHAPGKYAIVVKEKGVLLQGLHLVAPQWAGVWLQKGSSAQLRGVRIDGAGVNGVVTSEAALEMHTSRITGSGWAGLQMFGTAAGTFTAIVDDNRFDGNARGGIRLDGLGGMPAGVTLHKNELTGNKQFGIGAVNAVAIVDDNRIDGTLADGAGGYGYGVMVTGAMSNVTVKNSEITNNAAVGVLFDSGATGIVDDNRINFNGTPYVAEFTQNGTIVTVATRIGGGGGIWLQSNAGATTPIHVGGNELKANGFAAIALLGGARAIVDDNRIDGTAPGKESALASNMAVLGDGISITGGATATVTKNTITKSFRAGIMLDGVSLSTMQLSGNSVSSNQYALILQGTATALTDGNTFASNAKGDTATTAMAGTFAVLGKASGVPAPAQAPQ
jgi:parallel beta-helix repeat protein